MRMDMEVRKGVSGLVDWRSGWGRRGRVAVVRVWRGILHDKLARPLAIIRCRQSWKGLGFDDACHGRRELEAEKDEA
jgi:hypothetical protein